MNSARITIGTALLALALTACSTTPDSLPDVSVDPAASPSSSATATPTPGIDKNDRDQIIKEIGETATYRTDEDDPAPTMTFKVTSIKPIECDASYATPPKGTALAVSLEIETTASFSGPLEVNGQGGQISFSPRDWKGYAPNGTRMNTVDFPNQPNCLTDSTQLLPDFFGKGEKLNGIVILDVATPTGEVAFDPSGFGGWIWKYPSA